MVNLVDTHAHIFVQEIEDLNELMETSISNRVGHIIMPNIDVESKESLIHVHQKYKNNTSVLWGLHPCSVGENFQNDLTIINESIKQFPCSGIGEIGLDFYWSLEFQKEQITALENQLQWAVDMDLPVSLHTRNATAETIAICKNFKDLRGVFHCFGGNISQANEIIEMGMYLGIGGVLTFKNSALDKIIASIDLKHIVLETDTPYLAPHPFRGKQNQPKYLIYIAEKLAQLKNITVEQVALQTTNNAKQIFNLKL